jgi:lipopolysaccharide biosynthesis protein
VTKVLSFYLPQFHPTVENDAWWGPGFTEWTNVVKSKPRFSGHYQPHLPADLGFYDLRVPETRAAQAELARSSGIDGFCYYHYWFNGKRLLDRPLDDMLALGQPDFPFCICWANENWTKNWSGQNRLVLMPQAHSEQDDINHIKWLMNVFGDRRYITIDGRPLVLIYRADLLPDTAATLQIWRELAAKRFPGLYLVGVLNNFAKVDETVMLESYGFDAVVEFQPNTRYLPKPKLIRRVETRLRRTINSLTQNLRADPTKPLLSLTDVLDYTELARRSIAGLEARQHSMKKVFPTVIPSWDNSPRRRDGARVVQNVDPLPYERWLKSAIMSANKFGEEGIVFINAWNEWAEGCHLEPDQRVGHGFLEATRRAVDSCAANEVPTTGNVGEPRSA